jgi:hypothetical protein
MENRTDELLYLAAHAPTEIPSWYQPVFKDLVDPPRPAPPDVIADAVKEWKDRDRRRLRTYFEDDEQTGRKGNQALAKLADEYEYALKNWTSECYRRSEARQVARYFAWRWFWADQMLAHQELASVPRRDKL